MHLDSWFRHRKYLNNKPLITKLRSLKFWKQNFSQSRNLATVMLKTKFFSFSFTLKNDDKEVLEFNCKTGIKKALLQSQNYV